MLWTLILIAVSVYLFIRLSELTKRLEALEVMVRKELGGVVPTDAVLLAREAQYVKGSDANIEASPAPSPAPAPSYTPVVVESGEEKSARWLGWVGVIMLLLGVSFFLKYAFDNGYIGPMGQVAIGIIAGIVSIGIGQKLREKYLNYSDILLGAGVGILYFSIFSGFAFYDPVVISQPVAFMLMALVTALSMVIAIAGNTMGIAIIGVVGGFMTPMLLSTGENREVTLALYLLMLNVGVLGVSWFTKWVRLNYLAFIGTVMLFGDWMGSFYWRDPEGQLALTFFFLTMFFLVFLANSILHHLTRKETSTSGDLALICLNAMGYMAVCYSILEPKHHDVLGFFALVLAVLYLIISYVAYAAEKRDRTLNLTLPGIAVVFLSIAIPLQLTEYWISIAWLMESLVLVYVGLMLKEKPIQAFGFIVLLLGIMSMLDDVAKIRNVGMGDISSALPGLTPVMNMGFFLLLLAVAVFYVLAWFYRKNEATTNDHKKIISVFLVLANLLTIYAFTTEVSLKYSQDVARVGYQAGIDAEKNVQYTGGYASGYVNYAQLPATRSEIEGLQSRSSTVTTVLWALYATLLLVIGFMRRLRVLRVFGLIFFFLTACRIFIYVWEQGALYRIFSTITVGVIALGAAFLYAKYKDRIKEAIYD